MAGAIPIVQALKESLTGNRIESLMGILNGTSNYILSEMTSNGLDFDLALKQAQELGYAEADPTLDIDGHDAAHKLILLIRLAHGVNYPYTALSVRASGDFRPWTSVWRASRLPYQAHRPGARSALPRCEKGRQGVRGRRF